MSLLCPKFLYRCVSSVSNHFIQEGKKQHPPWNILFLQWKRHPADAGISGSG